VAYTYSPLRYPGGKAAITPILADIIKANNLVRGHYLEPYAGGAGLALSLLFKGYVHEIHLNDLDRSIWSFWNAVLNQTSEFIERISETEITLEEWHRQKAVQNNAVNAAKIDLAFSTFFLNRTNHSGVIYRGGVIGGLSQTGNYKLDCRFNKSGLIDRIKLIKKYQHRIHLYNLDAIDFMKQTTAVVPARSLYVIDPPYFLKGSKLYTNFYKPEDHAAVADTIKSLSKPWVVTYDNADEIKALYSDKKLYNFALNYSLATKRKGTELLVASDTIRIPTDLAVSEIA